MIRKKEKLILLLKLSLKIQALWVEFLALPHSTCMTFGRSLMSQFLLNKVGIKFLCCVEVIQGKFINI